MLKNFDLRNLPLTNSQNAILKNIHSAATKPKGLYFRTKYGNEIFLETQSKPFDFGSSISHLDISYSDTDEMLMIKSIVDGHGVHDRATNKAWKTSPIGPLTLEILETIGYKRNKMATFENSLGGFVTKKRRTKS
ncbi:hypothetical protein DSO57_1019927 [Entomophthora muscae]|uniref:Uncharacterized protein n=1 Tax=Entomophthora muscae TaxID=34485 RepID=A0ACC2RIU0_9FUNG|nr:hypothetical protein DSO57_1019927 [Entomophthora muscae]